MVNQVPRSHFRTELICDFKLIFPGVWKNELRNFRLLQKAEERNKARAANLDCVEKKQLFVLGKMVSFARKMFDRFSFFVFGGNFKEKKSLGSRPGSESVSPAAFWVRKGGGRVQSHSQTSFEHTNIVKNASRFGGYVGCVSMCCRLDTHARLERVSQSRTSESST